jgi:hypothetical protein
MILHSHIFTYFLISQEIYLKDTTVYIVIKKMEFEACLIDMNDVHEMYEIQPGITAHVAKEIQSHFITELVNRDARTIGMTQVATHPATGKRYAINPLNGKITTLFVDVNDPLIFEVYKSCGAQKPQTHQRFITNARKKSERVRMMMVK